MLLYSNISLYEFNFLYKRYYTTPYVFQIEIKASQLNFKPVLVTMLILHPSQIQTKSQINYKHWELIYHLEYCGLLVQIMQFNGCFQFVDIYSNSYTNKGNIYFGVFQVAGNLAVKVLKVNWK